MKNNTRISFYLESLGVSFDEAVAILESLFTRQKPLFNRGHQCLNLQKKECEDFVTFGTII